MKIKIDLNAYRQKDIGNSIEIEAFQGLENVEKTFEMMHNSSFEVVGHLGLSQLEKTLYGGLETSKVYSLVAPSGVGKTIMAVQIFYETMLKGKPAMFISTEMSKEVVIARLVCRLTGVPEAYILRNTVELALEERVMKAFAEVNRLLVTTQSVVVDKVYRLEAVLELIKQAKSTFGTPLVILDHLHNLQSSDNIYDRVSKAAHQIQEYAVLNKVAFFTFAQMSKADIQSKEIEQTGAKGAMDINETADVLMVLKRSKLKNTSNSTLTITKHRWGDAGEFELDFQFPHKIIKHAMLDAHSALHNIRSAF